MTTKKNETKKNDKLERTFELLKPFAKLFASFTLTATILGRLALTPFAWLSKSLIKHSIPNGAMSVPGVNNNVHDLMYSFNTSIEFEMFKRGFDQYLIRSALMVVNMAIFIVSAFILAKGILCNDISLRTMCFLVGTFSLSTVTALIIDSLQMIEDDCVKILNS